MGCFFRANLWGGSLWTFMKIYLSNQAQDYCVCILKRMCIWWVLYTMWLVTWSLQHSQFYIPTLIYTHHISSSMQHQWPPGRSVKNPTAFIRFKLKVCACVKSYWVIYLCDLMSVYEYVYIIIYIYIDVILFAIICNDVLYIVRLCSGY